MQIPEPASATPDLLRSARGERPRVLIAGGGPAAVETLLALRAVGGSRVATELLSPDRDLVYRPLAVAEPFGRGDTKHFPLAQIAERHGASVTYDALVSVDVETHRARTRSGAELRYDALVVATGAVAGEALPGAIGFAGQAGIESFRTLLDELRSKATRSVAFALTRGSTWPLALYELALLTAHDLRTRAVAGVRLTFSTYEESPLELMGEAASALMRNTLGAAGIELVTGASPLRVADGTLVLAGGRAVRAQRVVTLPRAEGRRIAGLPADAHGFLPVDEHGRVRGAADVYAAGDNTDFPVKQGGLATQQADAVAEHIAARAGVPLRPEPFTPAYRAVLLTGAVPLYLRRDAGGASEADTKPLWWPPGKIAGRYLAPYLAGGDPLEEKPQPMADRRAMAGQPDSQSAAAAELALALADDEAARGSMTRAVEWIDTAESLNGLLPPEYVAKRRRWSVIPAARS